MSGFIIIVFVFLMAFALLPSLVAVCSILDDYTAFKYELAFLAVSTALYISLYIFEAMIVKNVTEASIVKMACISVIGALVTIASFGIFDNIVMRAI